MLDNLENLTAREIGKLVRTRKLSCSEVTGYFIDRIDKLNPEYNAIITITRGEAQRQAKQVDKKIVNGDYLSPLAGVPIVIKDNINLKGSLTTCGSKMLAGHVSIYDATVVEELRASGLVIVGKANMDEFAMGSSNEHSYFGRVKNPLDPEKVPGGSSGGSAAAVASGMAPLALGSDTAGSVRLPASYCGLVGMRPTYGRVSRYGLIAFASSFDQIGPMAKNVKDAALLIDIISGHDRKDSTSIENIPEINISDIDQDYRDTVFGVPRGYLGSHIDTRIERTTNKIIERIQAAGYKIIDIPIPRPRLCLSVYYILANAEASSNLSRYDGVRYGYRSDKSSVLEEMYANTRGEGFGEEVKRRIMIGTYALSAGFYDQYYRSAFESRKSIADAVAKTFDKCDLIIMPSAPSTAFDFDEKINKPLAMYQTDIFMTLAALTGSPAITLPIGSDETGMPIGVQLMGRRLDDDLVIKGAAHIERLARD